MVLEAGKSKIKVPAYLLFGESPLPGSQVVAFFLCPHKSEMARKLSGISFIRALIPFLKVLPLLPNHLPESSPPTPSHCRLNCNR